jgi:hypothetical protein
MPFDPKVLDELESRLKSDYVMAGLPHPGNCRVQLEVDGVRFGVRWSDGHGIEVEADPGINSAYDFAFVVPSAAWEEFSKASPAPLNNTAQALVAQFGDKLIWGDRVKWAQYAPFVERILACLKPERSRGEVPALPRTVSIHI